MDACLPHCLEEREGICPFPQGRTKGGMVRGGGASPPLPLVWLTWSQNTGGGVIWSLSSGWGWGVGAGAVSSSSLPDAATGFFSFW